MLMHRIDL